MKKFICLILSILIFLFSIVPSFASNDGIMTLSVSTQYTIDEILENRTIGYNYDSFYDNSFNLLTYLNYLNTDEGHVCSTFHSRYCTVLEYYNSFLLDYEEIGSSYNYYVLSDLSSSKFNLFYIFSDSELSIVNNRFSIFSGDVRIFRFNGSFESNGYIIPWNSSSYSEDNYFDYPGSVSGILLSNANIYDGDGNLIFEKNMNIEEPEEETEGLVIDTLKDFLRWAILPSDDFFSSWKDEQLNKIDELDNVLTYPFALLVRFGDTVLSLDEEDDPKICWTDIEFSVKDEKYHLLDQGCFYFNSILETEAFYNFYVLYILFVKIIFVGMFINLCINKWNSIFNKG